MIIRFFFSAVLATTLGAGLAAADPDGDADRPVITGKLNSKAANTDAIWMDFGHPIKTGPTRRATQPDVDRLRRMETMPSVKCARIEYVHQCLSSQSMTLVRTHCRAGSTEASCCKAARDYVSAKICGPLWDRLKKAGKAYYPGIWLCKCIEQPRQRRRLERTPIRPR